MFGLPQLTWKIYFNFYLRELFNLRVGIYVKNFVSIIGYKNNDNPFSANMVIEIEIFWQWKTCNNTMICQVIDRLSAFLSISVF